MSTTENLLPDGPAPSRGARHYFSTLRVRDFGIAISVVLVFIVLSIATPTFLTTRNLLNVLDQSSSVGIIAIGATIVLISGSLDLSVGAIFAISGVLTAMMVEPFGVPLAIVGGLLVGAGLGLVNGLITTVGRVNSIITTLASGIIIRGFALVLTGGSLIRVVDPSFSSLGRGQFFGVKFVVIAFISVTAVAWFVMSKTSFGRYVYAVGGNLEAARLSGVRTDGIRITALVIGGVTAALAGVMAASRVSTGQADAAMGMEIDAIATVLIGGTSMNGGEGAIWRTVFGVLLVTLIGNGFNLLNFNPLWQQVFKGAVILAAVALDSWSKRTR